MTMIDLFRPIGINMDIVAAVCDVAVKATVLLCSAFAVHWLLGRRRALVRSAVWNACLIGLLLLPPATLVLPHFPLTMRWLPVSSEAPPATRIVNVHVVNLSNESERGSGPELSNASSDWRSVSSSVNRAPEIPRSAAGPQPIERPALRVSIPIALAALYVAIASLLAMRLGASMIKIVRFKRSCLPVEQKCWTDALAHWRSRLGVTPRLAFLVSEEVSVPIVAGWINPAVVLPKRLSDQTDSSLIAAVLVHELAHIHRADFAWNLVRKLAQIMYWPHPLCWFLGRVVGPVTEQACDDLCVHLVGGGNVYRNALLEVASGLVRRREPALGMAMARTTQLRRRLDWIDQTQGTSRCVSAWYTRVGLVAAIPLAAAALGALEFVRPSASGAENVASVSHSDEQASAPAQPDSIELTIRAKDTGKPIAGATVRPLIDMREPLFKTDAAGQLRIDLSKRKFPDTLSFDVWAEGYVQQRLFYSQTDPRYPKVPARQTVELFPGEQTIGGKITDEQGRPVAGATVKIWGYVGEKKDSHEMAYMIDAKTDDAGQWRCRCFRKMTFANLYLTHPDYLADDRTPSRRHGQPRQNTSPADGERAIKPLLDFSDVQIMTRGVAVAGEVRDQHGVAIADAEVGWVGGGGENKFDDDFTKTRTDQKGLFRFGHAQPGRLVLQVKAKGHAPELRRLNTETDKEPIVITLEPARTLSGRVVDTKGNPIPDAFIVIDAWRGMRSLGEFLKSGPDGRFRWEDAPSDTVLINASHPGFQGELLHRVEPGTDTILVLKRSISLSGTIRDAKTNKPIETVNVEVGTANQKTAAIIWAQNKSAFADQGQLHGAIDVEQSPEFRLRFQAKGYTLHESRLFRASEQAVNYDVRLAPSDRPQGVVVTGLVVRPDGGPLAGAEVAVTYPMVGARDQLPTIQIDEGKLTDGISAGATKTDNAGRFEVYREPDPRGQYFAVVVVHPEFYAEVPRPAIDARTTIVARPWGRIEGTARIGAKPAANGAVRYFADRTGNIDVPYLSNRGQTKTDSQGRFVFERVVPGDVRVTLGTDRAADSANIRSWSNGTLVEVRSGKTARADIGGSGRPVIARIVLPSGFDPRGDYVAHSRYQIESDRPHIPYPGNITSKRDGSMVGWAQRWWASAEGHEYRRKFYSLGRAKLEPDGTIRAEDVPPGEYRLSLAYSGELIQSMFSSPERIAHATKQFTIPPIEGGRSAEPFDLGELRPKPRVTLKVGQPAPAFDVETFDGQRVKLADYRGKYLLLNFWATWCGPCTAEIPELQSIQSRFAEDGRFAILSLSLDAEKDVVRKFAREKNLNWTQGYLGNPVEGGVTDAYHVDAIPAIFLIGPDGNIKAQGFRSGFIEANLARLIEQK